MTWGMGRYPRYVEHLPDLVAKGQVSMEEVDEGVRRILRVKKAIGYFTKRGKVGSEKGERGSDDDDDDDEWMDGWMARRIEGWLVLDPKPSICFLNKHRQLVSTYRLGYPP